MTQVEPGEELAKMLAVEQNVWVRLGLTKPEAVWQVRNFELTVGGPPPAWRPFDWRYPNARLVASVRRGKTVAAWLDSGRVRVAGSTASLATLGGHAQRERRQSRLVYSANEPLEWPSDEWRTGFSDQLNAFSDELIAESAPTYWSYDRAAAYLLGVSTQGVWNVGTRELVVRRQDESGRINRIVIDGSTRTVEVEVEGDRLGDATVELAGDIPGQTRRLSGPRREIVSFDVPDGLPPQPWVLLRHGSTWLDRRNLNRDHAPESGVEYTLPLAPSASDSFFTPGEQAEIRTTIDTVKVLFRVQSPELPAAQLALLDAKMDGLADALEVLSRNKWRDLAYGTLATVVLDHLIASDVANRLFVLLAHAIPRLSLPTFAALPF